MEDGTIVEWLKTTGDAVKRGDVLAVVETVKGAIEIESFEDGLLDAIVAAPGATVSVGDVLAHIQKNGSDDRTGPESGVEAPGRTAPLSGGEPERQIAPPKTKAVAGDRLSVRISPAARKRAQALNLDVAALRPGPDGTIGLSEVEAAQAISSEPQKTGRPAIKPGLDFDAMRRAIGSAMARSKREIPHYYVTSTLDLSAFLAWLEKANRARGVQDRLLYAAPLIKAVALALKDVPSLNGFYENDNHHTSEQVHVGVATALRGGGLIAPAIHDAGALTPDEAMVRLRDLVARVRSGRLRGSEMTDATVTLSILGADVADSLQPVIYPPQVAIIGCGAIRKRPWADGESVVVRPTMSVTVAGDHRVSDGRAAGRFLNRLDTLLQKPDAL